MRKALLSFSLLLFVLAGYSQCVVTDTVIVNPTCYGGSDGSITIEINNGVGNYQIFWNGSPGPGTETLENLSAGTYSVWITDGSTCSASETYTIDETPEPMIDVNVTNATCWDVCNGTIDITVTGNNAPYSFFWTEGAPGDYSGSNTWINICPMFYSGILQEENGCNTMFEFSVDAPPYMMLDVSAYATPCTGDSGIVSVNVQGGVPGYTYQWSNMATTPMVELLPIGYYEVTVTDANGCTAVDYGIVTSASNVYAFLNQDSSIYCHGDNTADIIVNVMGQPPINLYWSTGYEELGLTQTFSRYENLPAGLYYVTVDDSDPSPFSCPNIAWIEITEPEIISNEIDVTNVICYGDSTGYVSLNTYGGTMWNSYNYVWAHDAQLNSSYLQMIPAGTYYVSVYDDMGCEVTETIVIEQPDSMFTTPLINNGCYGMNNGMVVLNSAGGSPTYYYSLDSLTWQEYNIFDNLTAGNYIFYTKDAAYCFAASVSVDIVEPALMVLTTSVTDADCADPATGSATVNVSGGTSPYAYLWTGAFTTPVVSGLNPGSYNVIVTDANGCADTVNAVVSQLAAATISGHALYSMGYLLANKGDVYLYKRVSGVVGMIQEGNVLTGSGGSFSFSNVMPGDYSLKVFPDNSTYPNLLNTWYNETINWQDAWVITAGCEDVIDTVEIEMVEVPALAGNGSFSGNIYYWDNTKAFFAVGEPVEGAEVFVEQQPNDAPLTQGNTDVNGFYNITGLEENHTYDIHVDIAGLPLLSTYNNIPVTSQMSDYQNLNFYVDTTGTFGGIFVDSASSVKPVALALNVPVVYPNPVKSKANVYFTIEQPAEYQWVLFDESGRQISASDPVAIQPGRYEYAIPVPSRGTFFLVNRLSNNNYVMKLLSE